MGRATSSWHRAAQCANLPELRRPRPPIRRPRGVVGEVATPVTGVAAGDVAGSYTDPPDADQTGQQDHDPGQQHGISVACSGVVKSAPSVAPRRRVTSAGPCHPAVPPIPAASVASAGPTTRASEWLKLLQEQIMRDADLGRTAEHHRAADRDAPALPSLQSSANAGAEPATADGYPARSRSGARRSFPKSPRPPRPRRYTV